ncbi:L-threonylcarbamoyladenylate synthase [Candidatus Harpocratesius sp.]
MCNPSFITKVIKIDPEKINNHDLREAVIILQNEGIVAFPTETVYGLGASAFSEKAIKKIFRAKGRPLDNPLIVHIDSMEMLESIVLEVPKNVRSLCEEFWPGPLTILFQKNSKIPDCVTAGLPTVAIRMPSNRIAQRLIHLSGLPLAAPSANISGKPSPTSPSHVKDDFDGKIPLIIDGGQCQVGVESTVINVNSIPPLILRPGGLDYEELRKFIPDLKIYDKHYKNKDLEKHPSTPGLKYRHYSPSARVILIEQNQQNMQSVIFEILNSFAQNMSEIGYIHTNPEIVLEALYLEKLGYNFVDLTKKALKTIVIEKEIYANVAQKIFWALRMLDSKKVKYIVVEGISEQYSGLAVMNRLRKAAWKIIKK